MLRTVLTTTLILTLGASTAIAAQGDATTTTTTVAPVVQVPTTPKEQVSQAKAAVGELDNAVQKVLTAIAAATAKKDFILLNCLNQKLTELRGYQKAASDAKFALETAIANENGDQAQFNFGKISIALRSGREQAIQADACVTSVGTTSGEGGTRLVVENKNGESQQVVPPQSGTSSGTTRPADASPDGG